MNLLRLCPRLRSRFQARVCWLLIALLGFLSACRTTPATPTLAPRPTPVPVTATALPSPTPLPTPDPEQVSVFQEVADMVQVCEALHPNRKRTVLMHLQWLNNTDEIPAQFRNLYGQNVRGKLAFGANYMVAAQWKLDGRPEDSCLIPIGEMLNSITRFFQGEPVPEFGFAASFPY